ncbi:hypothetical protein Tco_1503853 [Tanacetum coccineum]
MVWRHPSAAIDDPRPASGSFSMADVCRLSTHVIKLRDMPEGVLVLSGLSHVWKSRVCDLVLRGADGNVMGIHDFICLSEWTGAEVQEDPHLDIRPTLQMLPFYRTLPYAADVAIPDPTPEDLAVGTPSAKILAKVEAFQKRKASTSCATSSHVAKHARSSLAQSSSSTTRRSLFGGSSATPAAEGPGTRDSRGKGIMADDAAAPDVSGDAIHANFFPFSVGPYYATYLEGGVAGNYEFTREEWDAPYQPTFGVLTKEVFKDLAVCKTVVDQFPISGEMVRVESLSDDQLTVKMSVLHCMMMSHGGELLARYRGLLQSHHEYVSSTDFRLKGYEERVAGLTGLEHQVSALKRQIFGLNDKLSSSDASFAKSKAKGKERKKKIKSLPKSLDNLHAEVARLSADLNRATVLEAEKDNEILRLKTTPLEFASFFCGHARFERGLSMHQTKDEFASVLKKMAHFMPGAQGRLTEASPLVAQTDYAFLNKISEHVTKPLSTVTPASESLELLANVVPASSVVASEQNEEWVNAMVDGSDPEMTDGATHAKSGGVFVQGTSHVLDDVAEVTAVGSERVSFDPADVVVALFVGEKGDGFLLSSAADEEAAANPYRV